LRTPSTGSPRTKAGPELHSGYLRVTTATGVREKARFRPQPMRGVLRNVVWPLVERRNVDWPAAATISPISGAIPSPAADRDCRISTTMSSAKPLADRETPGMGRRDTSRPSPSHRPTLDPEVTYPRCSGLDSPVNNPKNKTIAKRSTRRQLEQTMAIPNARATRPNIGDITHARGQPSPHPWRASVPMHIRTY
jgi:hypothetical protein